MLLLFLISTAMMPKDKYHNKAKPWLHIPHIVHADDYDDLQIAVDVIESDNKGGVILLTPGRKYTIANSPLKISKSGLSIVSYIEANAAPKIEILNDTNGIEIKSCNAIKLQGFTLIGTDSNTYNGIYALDVHDLYIENITIRNFGKNGWMGSSMWGTTFIRTNIYNIRGNGFNIKAGTSNTWINCYVHVIDSIAFKITSWYSTLINCSADRASGCAYSISNCPSSGQFSWNTTAINCGAEKCSGGLIHLSGGLCGFDGFHARLSGDSLTNDAIITIGNRADHAYIKNVFIFGNFAAYTFDCPYSNSSVRLENFHPYCFDVDSAIFKSKEADIIWDHADKDTIP